ncbi:uncharacterized mitochondrial protein AtMg00810-like [Arachis stenosperma]|uniref:uncharacterized mitochondrial protein AtMg00810-like n=1 Tax=Arachis stenosperma TaxID=217475 RepID=UPI0025AD0E39|nr:uncharacterized mitochondrial protein AtMg00810-like [Arachis stenosperma]
MNDCKPCATPLPSTLKIQATGGAVFDNPQLYRSVVGSLQYLTVTRPDLAYSVNKVSQFMQSPLEAHWKLVKRVLRYVQGTAAYGLKIHKDPSLKITAYCDSHWAGDPNDRKLVGDFCVFMGRNLVSWQSKKQGVVARSSTEADWLTLWQN